MFDNLLNRLPNYEIYDIVMGSCNATGNLATISANPYLGRDEMTPSCEEEEFKDNITMKTFPHSGDKRARTSDRLQNKRNKGKGKISYEESITAMANAYMTSKESRQYVPTTAATLDQVADIVMEMTEIDMRTRAKALEFFRMNESSHNMFLNFTYCVVTGEPCLGSNLTRMNSFF